MPEISDTLHHLCHSIFIGTHSGAALLKLLKASFLDNPVFPQDAKQIERYGGPAMWAAFRAGQLDFILQIEGMAIEHEQKTIAQNTPQ